MEKIIEKVKKLLALSQSSNPNEASLALSKAQELIAKYNLTITEEENKVIVEEVLKQTTKSVSNYRKQMLTALAEHFGVLVLLREGSERRQAVIIAGRPQDVKCFIEVFNYAEVCWERFYKSIHIKGETRSESYNNRASLFKGFIDGMTNELVKRISETALVITKSDELKEYEASLGVHSYKTSRVRDFQLYCDGYREGGYAIRNQNKQVS